MAHDELRHAQWRKSSYSGNTGNCVEVADLSDRVAVRDSKDLDGPKLIFTRDQWRAFLEGIKSTL